MVVHNLYFLKKGDTMRIMFIGLLLSVTIGGYLYAAGLEGNEKFGTSRTSVVTVDISSSDSEVSTTVLRTTQTGGPIATLSEMRWLAKQAIDELQAQNFLKKNLLVQELKIPKRYIIDLQVFYEYAEKENLIPVSKFGCLRRTLCCKPPKPKSLFMCLHRLEREDRIAYEKWEKKLFIVCSGDGDQMKAQTKSDNYDGLKNVVDSSSDSDIVHDDVSVSNVTDTSQVVEIFNQIKQNDDNNEAEEFSEKKLKKIKWEKEILVQKAKLNYKLQKMYAKQQESEATLGQWNERLGALIVVAVAFFWYLSWYLLVS